MITQGLRPGLCRSVALAGLIYVFTANQLLCRFDAIVLRLGKEDYLCERIIIYRYMTYILLLIVLILLALLIFILIRKPQGQGVETELITLQAKLNYQEEELRLLKAEKLQLTEEKQSLSIQLAKADATIDQLVERLKEAEESKADLADLLEERFRGITTKIIDERAEQIRTRSEESLQPLR